MSLTSVCAEIADVVADPTSGIRVALNEPPETLSVYPTSWVNPVEGTVARTSGDAMWLHRIELIVYVAARKANLPTEFALVAPLVSSVEKVIWGAYEADEFSQNVSKCVVASYRVGLRDFAGIPQHTITFVLDVKEHTT